MSTVNPYTALASVYDTVMEHVDYEGWADYILYLLDSAGFDADDGQASMLELGGGTGAVSEILLSERNATLLLTDQSEDMLAKARVRLEPFQDRVRIEAMDFSGPWSSNEERFHVIYLLYDGFNYLLEEADVAQLFSEVATHLHPGGLFVFDQSTPANSINNEAFFEDEGEQGDVSYVRKSEYDHDTAVHTTRFEINGPDGTFQEEHLQKAWTRSQVSGLLEANGLRVVASYDGFSLDPSTDESERIHWVVGPASNEEGA